MGLLGWGVVGLGVGGVWLLACGAFLEDLGVCWSLDSVLLVPLGIQIEPSGALGARADVRGHPCGLQGGSKGSGLGFGAPFWGHFGTPNRLKNW